MELVTRVEGILSILENLDRDFSSRPCGSCISLSYNGKRRNSIFDIELLTESVEDMVAGGKSKRLYICVDPKLLKVYVKVSKEGIDQYTAEFRKKFEGSKGDFNEIQWFIKYVPEVRELMKFLH